MNHLANPKIIFHHISKKPLRGFLFFNSSFINFLISCQIYLSNIGFSDFLHFLIWKLYSNKFSTVLICSIIVREDKVKNLHIIFYSPDFFNFSCIYWYTILFSSLFLDIWITYFKTINSKKAFYNIYLVISTNLL